MTANGFFFTEDAIDSDLVKKEKLRRAIGRAFLCMPAASYICVDGGRSIT
jgi:hypothetical protein